MPLNADQRFQFRQNLFRDLRNELGHIKTCQTTLFLIGVTGTGVFLGLISRAELSIKISYLLLIPLLILLPLWIIFYDKARTIARIVGFLRVQENLAQDNAESGLIGWESAMREYWRVRDKYDEWHYDDIFEGAKKIQMENDPEENYKIRESVINSTYWSTVYLLFLSFNVVCFGMSFYLFGFSEEVTRILSVWLIILVIVSFIEVKTRFAYKGIKRLCNREKPDYKAPHTKFYSILWSTWFIVLFIDILFLSYLNYRLLVLPDFISIIIFMIFGSLFLSTSMIAYWMLFSLIKGYDGRYSYKSFQLRWEIALRGIEFSYNEYVKPSSIRLAENHNYGYRDTILYRTGNKTYFVSYFTHGTNGRESICTLKKEEALELFTRLPYQLMTDDEAFP